MKKIWALLAGAMLLVSTQAGAQLNVHADDHAVVALGKRKDPQSGKVVEGYAIIHYRRGHMKPDHAGGKKNQGGSSTCFAHLAKKAKWKGVEDYVVTPDNASDIPDDTIRALMATALESWNAESPTTIFGLEIAPPVGFLPGLTVGITADGINEVVFGSIAEPGAIAVTYVWGLFGGPPKGRELVEWDMKFDDVDFTWSTTTPAASGAMDFHNIAQHETGHAGGLGHPDNICIDETMYAFAAAEETTKRDLNTGDIAGIVRLYK